MSEVHGLAGGIGDASQTSLCMCPGWCAGKERGQRLTLQGSRETLQMAESRKSLEGLALGILSLIRQSAR